MVQNERKFMRTDFYVNGFLNDNGKKKSFKVLNVSLKGALVYVEEDNLLSMGRVLDISILLNQSDVTINAQARVVHICDKNRFGLKFDTIDLDSMIHLRRLLELNTIPEGEIERELSFLKS